MGSSNIRGRSPPPSYGTLNPASSAEDRYEEFFGGAITCPTCHGAGSVPRDRENELVALIPVSDSRLKPRRTTLYVFLAVLLCVLIGAICLFIFFPRAVEMKNNGDTLHPTQIYINDTEGIVYMTVTNAYNVTNQNFFPITVEKLAVTVLFDQKVVSEATNTTLLKVPARGYSTHYIQINITFTGDEGYIAYYCSRKTDFGHTLLLPFEATSSSTWWGRSEETSLTSYQHVRCSDKDIEL